MCNTPHTKCNATTGTLRAHFFSRFLPVVTMRAMELDSYTYLHAIQRAYFAANEDIRQAEVLARHAAPFGVAERIASSIMLPES